MAKDTKLSDYSQLSLENMTLCRIAQVIKKDWIVQSKNGIYFGAVPYVNALMQVDKITDPYIAETGEDLVRGFLSNAATWKGPVAKEIKAHLNKLIAK